MNSVQPLIASTIFTGFRRGETVQQVVSDVLSIVANMPNCTLCGELPCEYAGVGLSNGLHMSFASLTYDQIEELVTSLIAGAPEPFKKYVYQGILQFYYYKTKPALMEKYIEEYKTLYGEDRAYFNAKVGYAFLSYRENETAELLAELDTWLERALEFMDKGAE